MQIKMTVRQLCKRTRPAVRGVSSDGAASGRGSAYFYFHLQMALYLYFSPQKIFN